MRCPHCDSEQIELVSMWGSQIVTSQVRCEACGAYFEAIREDFEARERDPADGSRECATS